MTLERYRRNRLIILTPDDTAHDAARAMEANHVGAVLVQRQGKLVGILTDRDIAVRVTAYSLDPNLTPLREVMTQDPVWLSSAGTEQDALALMRERHIRRVPILAEGQTVGMVTLDDLMLSLPAAPAVLAEVVREQLEDSSSKKPSGVTHPTKLPRPDMESEREVRHVARAGRTLRDFTRRLQESLGLPDPAKALSAFEIVASALVRRVRPATAVTFTAQLPSLLRERLMDEPAGPDRSVTRESIAAEMAERLNLDEKAASSLLARVGAALKQFVGGGDKQNATAPLPHELDKLTQQGA